MATSWCFTLNNYTDDEHDDFLVWATTECAYAIIGREEGDEETPHLQGYFRLPSKKGKRYFN